MNKILLLTLREEKGNVCFVETNYNGDLEDEFQIITEVFDDSYNFEDIFEFFKDEDICLFTIICENGCLLFAARFIHSVCNFLGSEVSAFVVSEELENELEYRIEENHFRVVNKIENLKSVLNSYQCNHVNLDYSEIPVSYSKQYYDAMNNGVIVALSGMYPDGVIGSNKHILVNDAVEFINSYQHMSLNFNSAVIFNNQAFDKDIYEKLLRLPGLTCHFHFTYDESNYTFDNSSLHTNMVKMHINDYVNKLNDEEGNEKLHILYVDSSEDYEALNTILNNFFYNGIIKKYNFLLQNECRFSDQCLLYKFYRYQVKNDCVNPCLDGACNVGRLADSKLRKIANIDAIRKNENIECISMGNEEQILFKILKMKYPNLNEFFFQKNIYRNLKSESKIFREYNNIEISNSKFSSIYNGIEEPEAKKELSRICLYKIEQKYYLFSINKLSFVRIDPKIALILEGMIKNAKPVDVVSSLMISCGTDNESAKKIYYQGCEIIGKASFI